MTKSINRNGCREDYFLLTCWIWCTGKDDPQLVSSDFAFCSLGSCSQHGNSYLVRTPEACIMVDYGVRLRRTERALQQAGIHPSDIDAIFITHEHTDHIQGLRIKYPLHVRHGIRRIYATPRTLKRLGYPTPSPPFYPLSPGCAVEIGDVAVTGLRKPHDAVQPVAYRLRAGRKTLAVVTDLGEMTPGLTSSLRGSTHLIFESNHDVQMEKSSGRPPSVIRRVLGERGHLSNNQAAEALSRLATKRTEEIMLAHLSIECNQPKLALKKVGDRLAQAGYSGQITAADPSGFSGWVSSANRNIRPSVGL